MAPHIHVFTLALPLAGVSALLALAFVRQLHARSCTRVSEWVCAASVLLCIGDLVLLACWLWIVALFFQRGINPDLMADGQQCPLQPSVGPRFPCDPLPNVVAAVGEAELVRQLLVPALVWYGLSLAVWLLGRHATRNTSQQAAARSE